MTPHYHVWVIRREQDYPGGPLVERLRRRPERYKHRNQANRERSYIAREGIPKSRSRAFVCYGECRP